MPYYKKLNGALLADKRTAEKLLKLRVALDEQIPTKTVDTTLLLASWNIRELGGTKYGGRDKEALFYLAEILSRFDLIAVQEVRDNLDSLDELLYMLGGWWKYLVSDVTVGTAGNQERLAFIYDSRKISFGGLSGEMVPPTKKTGDLFGSEFSFARTPYLAGFKAGWFKFTICAQHLYYGDDKADDPQRLKEAEMIVAMLSKRMDSKDRWANNTIIVGDFNIFTTDDKTFMALERARFRIPTRLRGKYTNANLDKPFDQIAFLAPDIERQIDIAKAGVFPFFDYVYTNAERAIYLPDENDKTYKAWRTFKMSDHLPIWVALNVDFGEDYLTRKIISA